MKTEIEKQRQRDFLEIEDAINSRLTYLSTFNFSENELKYREQELSIILKKLEKIKYHRLNPLKSIETVHGIKFKLGEYFHIPGDELTKYKIVLFPDQVTIRGVTDNPSIGKPWVCEVYVESARKIEKKKEEKTKRIKKEKKPKKVKIKVGDYFALVSNNTIYKAIEIEGKKVVGTNELKSKNAPKRVKINIKKTEVILKTKKDYKKQHKAEKNYGKN